MSGGGVRFGGRSGTADLGLLRQDDELVEQLRRRRPTPAQDRIARLFDALLAEVDGTAANRRRAVPDRC
ncbi:hypothetical protein ACIBSV_38565 [Embleya sp. NPDC050154]|uniref:hypothetical protein n=1 Tax=unclassified Embleya TaxID=2699296 RepID=UPI0037BBEFD1|nr:hypothetical protein OG948_22395 [Embleya sp. NBC_00888]